MSYQFDLPITLLLSANATIFGEQLSVAPYDYLLVNSGVTSNKPSLSALSLGQIIQYHDLTTDTIPNYKIDSTKYTYLVNFVDSLVRDKSLAIASATPATPTQYPNSVTGPSNEPISGHYTQYLASILFGHPLARAPIRNEDNMYQIMYNQNLGAQFIEKLSVNNYAVTHAIFEQFLAYESTNNRLSVNDSYANAHLSVGSHTWKNMPFASEDTISFIVQMQGSVSVDSSSYGGSSGSVVVPFSSIYAGDTNITSAGVVAAKKWLIRITLDA